MHNAAQLAEWLQTLALEQVAVTATIDSTGRLGAVGGLWPKLLAASKEAAQMGLLRLVVVAEDQTDVTQELLDPTATPLRVLKAATLQDVIEQLYEEHGPRFALKQYEREQCATIEILGVSVPIEQYYQTLPLLQEVRRELLPKERTSAPLPTTNKLSPRDHLELPGTDLLRWEEELQQAAIEYKRLSLPDIFHHFASLTKSLHGATPRFVVLGPPGSGKTTLMQYLGWLAVTDVLQVANRPLIAARIRLREWETWMLAEKNAGRGFASYLTERYALETQAPTTGHWRQWLSKGEVLLLLDGLDETTNIPIFYETVKATLTRFSNCPTVLTCRTVSFARHRTLCPGFPLFTLAGFDEKTRNAYIHAFPAEQRPSYKPETLISHLDHTPSLRPLATNPLLLSILCSVAHQQQGNPLPATRTSLYQQALVNLLAQRVQRTPVQYPGEEPTPEEKLVLLQRVAFHLFVEGERRLTFNSEELGQALKRALSEEGYGNATAPWANALRADLTHNSGLLRHGVDQTFFFLHVTVQEFLVAANLSRFMNKNSWQAKIPLLGSAVSIRSLLEGKSWDPRWHEVMIFLAGQLHDPRPLLNLLATAKHDDLFKHRLALAVHCLVESQSAFSSESALLAARIRTSILSYWEQQRSSGSDAAIPHLTQALPGLGSIRQPENVEHLQLWLQQRWRSSQVENRMRAIELIGRIGGALMQHEGVLNIMVTALRDPELQIRIEAVASCQRIGAPIINNPQIRPALEHLALGEPDLLLRSWARQALELLPLADSERRPLTSRNLRASPSDTKDQSNQQIPDSMREEGEISSSSSETIATCLFHLQKGSEAERARAATLLGQLGATAAQHPEALSVLLQVILHDHYGGVRAQATAALGDIGPVALQHPHSLPALLATLRDQDQGVRAQAAKALGQMGAAIAQSPEALPDLLFALRDENRYVRFRAAEALSIIMVQGIRLFRRWWGKIHIKTIDELTALRHG